MITMMIGDLMKILYMHANKVRVEAGPVGRTPSARRKNERKLRRKFGDLLPALDTTNSIVSSENALVALIHIESNDEALDLGRIKNDVFRSRALIGAANIVISAFGHLDGNSACPALAKEIINRLVETIVVSHPDTREVPFGWDKSLDISVPRHHYNIAFRSFKPTFGERISYYLKSL